MRIIGYWQTTLYIYVWILCYCYVYVMQRIVIDTVVRKTSIINKKTSRQISSDWMNAMATIQLDIRLLK